jgi:hypothetical protein
MDVTDKALADFSTAVRTAVKVYPELTPHDFYVLGFITERGANGFPLSDVRKYADRYCTLRKFTPSIERLERTGLVRRHTTGSGRVPSGVTYTRTAKQVYPAPTPVPTPAPALDAALPKPTYQPGAFIL